MGIEILVLLLVAFMVIATLIAVEARDLLSSVIALGAAGFALSVIDLLVGAPDLAITQVVVEVIALILLIRAVQTRRERATGARGDALRTGGALLAAGVLLAVVFFAVGGRGGTGTMPPFGKSTLAARGEVPAGVGAEYLAGAAEQTGAANAVTAVLLDYRAYDTLGEATIIFVAVLGAYAILRPIGRRRTADLQEGDA